MDGAKYRATLEENPLQSATDLRLGQEDNDPEHTARATMEPFRSKHIRVRMAQTKSRPESN